MGIVPYPIDPGADCRNCDIFTNYTPAHVFASFTGIGAGDAFRIGIDYAPPNGVHTLTQDSVQPCRWMYIGSKWTIDFQLFDVASAIQLVRLFGIPIVFNSGNQLPCTFAFSNLIVNPVGRVYFGGMCQISWV